MIRRVTSIAQTDLTEGADPYGICAADNGALWVTLVHSGAVVRLSADGGRRDYPIGA
ncbi:MAG: hypothetical protein WCZ29_25115 [Mycolicibacterium vanbaalenii]|uniref:hypothetical protein n=1 Tax=Mycolicibacterium vanbaalenii TaxID=110539 RepID=UPI003564299E